MATNETMCKKTRPHGRWDEWHGTGSFNIQANRAIQESNFQAYAFYIFRAPVSQRPRMSAQQGMAAAPPWWNQSGVQEVFAATECTFWMDETAAVAVEVPMPDTRAGSERALRDLPSYFASSLKKRSAVEVCERHLSEEERQQFRSAKAVEVSNFIAAKAFEALPEKLRQHANKQWRCGGYWHGKAEGGWQPKGESQSRSLRVPRSLLWTESNDFSNHDSPDQATADAISRFMSPQDAKRWCDRCFPAKQAIPWWPFLYTMPRDLWKDGTPSRVNHQSEEACYGLVDAPLEWYRSISDFFAKLGLQKCWSDACCWVYVVDGLQKGLFLAMLMISFLVGMKRMRVWCTVLKSIQTEYKWGDWEEKRLPNAEFKWNNMKIFPFRCHNRSMLKTWNISTWELLERKTEMHPLRSLRNTASGLAGRGLMARTTSSATLQCWSRLAVVRGDKSTIETIYKANRLLDKVKDMKDTAWRYMP